MKCLKCGYEWSQKLKKNKRGQYIFKDVKCPKCGSKDFSVIMAGVL